MFTFNYSHLWSSLCDSVMTQSYKLLPTYFITLLKYRLVRTLSMPWVSQSMDNSCKYLMIKDRTIQLRIPFKEIKANFLVSITTLHIAPK